MLGVMWPRTLSPVKMARGSLGVDDEASEGVARGVDELQVEAAQVQGLAVFHGVVNSESFFGLEQQAVDAGLLDKGCVELRTAGPVDVGGAAHVVAVSVGDDDGFKGWAPEAVEVLQPGLSLLRYGVAGVDEGSC